MDQFITKLISFDCVCSYCVELLERIKAQHLTVNKVKPSKSKSNSKAKKSAQKTVLKPQIPALPVAEAAMDVCSVVSLPVSRPYDDIFEENFKRYLFPEISQSVHCDTMAFFPTAFANCLNSGNNIGLADLIRVHLDQQCDIRLMCNESSMSCYSFLKFFELMNEIHPDRIMHVSTTDIVDNQVTAAVYMKYTDCKLLYEAVARTVTDPSLLRVVPATRSQYLSTRMKIENRPDEERDMLNKLVDSDFDLVVYGCVYVHMTVDAKTRKATGLQMSGDMHSAHVAQLTDIDVNMPA